MRIGNCSTSEVRHRSGVCVLLVVGLITFLLSSCAASDQPTLPQRVDLVVVPEKETWLLAIAAPVAAKLAVGGKPPMMVALWQPPDRRGAGFLKDLDPQRCLVLASTHSVVEACGAKGICAHRIATGDVPLEAGILVAKLFWRSPESIVMASLDNPEAVVLGAALAAHAGVPFVPFGFEDGLKGVSRAIRELAVQHVVVVNTSTVDLSAHMKGVARRTEFLDGAAAQARIVEKIGIANVRNVILARTPAPGHAESASSWLAPYLSLLRGSLVVLTDSTDGASAETRLRASVARHRLRPRSVTILGNCDAIGEISVKGESVLGEYEVTIEPCSGPGKGGAAAFAVGRFPLPALQENSVLLARGLARERWLSRVESRVLMIGNPNPAYGPLPFCETVSRATAEEFKNFGVHLSETYGAVREDKDLVANAEAAHLIIFEGHITDLWLFEGRIPDDGLKHEEQGDDGGEEHRQENEENIIEEVQWLLPAAPPAAMHLNSLALADTWDYGPSGRDYAATQTELLQEGTVPSLLGHLPEAGQAEGPPRTAVSSLRDLPLVVLQSCHSLDGDLPVQIFDLGAVGLIGSVTNIHSASGSAFIKAFCDGLLYRDETVGEALREARNYFLCLAALKSGRGHKEQAKAYRVALSFRLWGDPEMRIPLSSLSRPKRAPVSARFVDERTVEIAVPKRRLAKCVTEKYSAHIFPGAQLAGIVKRRKNTEQRSLMPLYFFKLPAMGELPTRGRTKLSREGDEPNRAAFLTDPLRRYVYILYFPKKGQPGATFRLRFAE